MIGYGKALLAVGVAIATVACTTASGTPRVGYDGRVPLFAFQDGYVEDRSPTGPVPRDAGEGAGPNIPGQERYAFIPGAQQWYTFEGPQGLEGMQGPAGPQGPQGVAGPAGPAGAQGVAGIMGGRGTDGVLVLEGPAPHRRTVITAAPTPQGVREAQAR